MHGAEIVKIFLIGAFLFDETENRYLPVAGRNNISQECRKEGSYCGSNDNQYRVKNSF